MTETSFRWITPSIFQQFPGHETVDEWTLATNHPDTAPGILKNHWDNWVGLSDFQTIANAGFNTVRIPVGCTSSSFTVSHLDCLPPLLLNPPLTLS